jgi:hypothetical protein
VLLYSWPMKTSERRLWLLLTILALLTTTSSCGDDAGDDAQDAGLAGPDRDASAQDAAGGDQDGSTPVGTRVSADISPDEGGMLVSDDGKLTLEFPAGAVAAMTTVSVHQVAAADGLEGALGPTYVLEPDGSTFEQPVKVTVAIDTPTLQEIGDTFEPQVVQGPSETVLAFLVGESGGDAFVPDNQSLDVQTDPSKAFARGEISHFSSIAARVIIASPSANFEVAAKYSTGLSDAKVGDSKQGVVSIFGLATAGGFFMFVPPNGIDSVSYESSMPAAATAADGPLEGTTSHSEKGKCLAVGEGEFAATIGFRFDHMTPNGLRQIRSSTTLVQPFKCSAPPVPACEPNTTAAPTTAPAITTNFYNDPICRAAFAYVFGTDFDPAGMCAAVGDQPATPVNATSPTEVRVQIPEDQPVGPTTITLETAAGTIVSDSTLTVLADIAPEIDSISPTSGAAGTEVTFTGKHLLGTDYVTMTGTASQLVELTVTDVTDTSFKAIIEDSGFGLVAGDLHVQTLLTANCSASNPNPAAVFNAL